MALELRKKKNTTQNPHKTTKQFDSPKTSGVLFAEGVCLSAVHTNFRATRKMNYCVIWQVQFCRNYRLQMLLIKSKQNLRKEHN